MHHSECVGNLFQCQSDPFLDAVRHVWCYADALRRIVHSTSILVTTNSCSNGFLKLILSILSYILFDTPKEDDNVLTRWHVASYVFVGIECLVVEITFISSVFFLLVNRSNFNPSGIEKIAVIRCDEESSKQTKIEGIGVAQMGQGCNETMMSAIRNSQAWKRLGRDFRESKVVFRYGVNLILCCIFFGLGIATSYLKDILSTLPPSDGWVESQILNLYSSAFLSLAVIFIWNMLVDLKALLYTSAVF